MTRLTLVRASPRTSAVPSENGTTSIPARRGKTRRGRRTPFVRPARQRRRRRKKAPAPPVESNAKGQAAMPGEAMASRATRSQSNMKRPKIRKAKKKAETKKSRETWTCDVTGERVQGQTYERNATSLGRHAATVVDTHLEAYEQAWVVW